MPYLYHTFYNCLIIGVILIKIGTDIVAIDRVDKALKKFGDRYKDRFLTQNEQKLSSKVESIAGYWASKEAISKALGCGIGNELRFDDIEIYKDSKNAPHFRLKERSKFKIKQSSLSISHDGGFAIAVVVIEL